MHTHMTHEKTNTCTYTICDWLGLIIVCHISNMPSNLRNTRSWMTLKEVSLLIGALAQSIPLPAAAPSANGSASTIAAPINAHGSSPTTAVPSNAASGAANSAASSLPAASGTNAATEHNTSASTAASGATSLLSEGQLAGVCCAIARMHLVC